jgi:5-methylcytosine-specific restriction endonuclease McrBC regulatory subunit McrC
MVMRTTDNCCKPLSENENCEIEPLRCIAGKKLDELSDLLVFPHSLDDCKDGINDQSVFSLSDNNELITHNIMGFVGRNETQLTISSRFYPNGNDYFLHHMLQKVFNINIFKFDQTTSNDDIWDFYLYLFPYLLKKAYAQGLYKAYRKEQYNDANVKGTIDVKRHIRINIPFAGKIAYNTREYSYDNPLTQLVRHTIEHIKQHPFGNGILNNDSETRDVVGKICFATQKHYNKNDRQKVIHENLKPVTHPYFTEYKILQKICLQILRYEKLTFGEEKDKVYGLLFDGAWLWEEYIAKVFEERELGIEHRIKDKAPIEYLFIKKGQQIVPDFIRPIPNTNSASFIGDTKYKHIDERSDRGEKGNREDYFQIIAYMYRYSCKTGYLIFPYDKENKEDSSNECYLREREMEGERKGKVVELGMKIPQGDKLKFSEFQTQMRTSEENLIKNGCFAKDTEASLG